MSYLFFQTELKSFCGNQIKEDDEQCDCGFTALDCQEMGDRCCTPREGATELVQIANFIFY